MNKLKKISIVLAFMLLIVFEFSPASISAIAYSDLDSENDYTPIYVSGSVDINNIPQSVIDDLVSSYPNADNITIYDFGYIEEDFGLHITPFQPYPVVYETMLTVLRSNQVGDDKFVFSVAKGQETTITETYTVSYKGSITGEWFDKVKIGAEKTITGSYQKNTKYNGPPESSIFNSRQFRIRFFQDEGTFVQKAGWYNLSDWLYDETRHGSYEMPTSFAAYSVDVSIS